jgi:hypothetical protein
MFSNDDRGGCIDHVLEIVVALESINQGRSPPDCPGADTHSHKSMLPPVFTRFPPRMAVNALMHGATRIKQYESHGTAFRTNSVNPW